MKKVPYVSQVQESECGLCCLSMIMKYYGDNVSVKNLSQKNELGRDGVSIKKLKEILEYYQYEVNLYECSINNLIKFKGNPVILFWDNSHYVVLENIKNDIYTIIDPGFGRLSLKYEEFILHYSNIVLFTSAPKRDYKVVEKEDYFKLYKKFFAKNKTLFLFVLFISIISYSVVFISPNIMKYLTDIYSESIKTNVYPITLISISMAIFVFVTLLKNVTLIKFSSIMDKSLYNQLIYKLFHVPYRFFLTRNSSDLIYRINLLKTNREFLVDTVLKGIIDFGMILTINVLLAMLNIKIFIIVVCLSLLMAIILSSIRKKMLKYHKLELIEVTKLQGLEYESLSAMFTIKASNQENYTQELVKEQYIKSLKMFQKRALINSYYGSITSIFSTFGPIIIFMTITVYFKYEIKLSEAIFGYTLLGIYFSSLSSIFNAFNVYGTLKNNLERINDIADQDVVDNKKEKEKISSIESIEFRNVYFKYPGQQKYILKNINFKVEKGTKNAFIGKTGSGKSTIMGLILGLHQPTKGNIFINGIDIQKIDTDCYKDLIGFVPQEPYIFNKSIADNISMNQKYTEKQVIDASKIAQINSEVESMPMKYQTVVSEYGHNISGGQKQRIILARAIIKNPDIILLDEATSSVDNETEEKISYYLSKNNKTQIIIAHRLSTIQNADKIMIVKDGEIKEVGTNLELMETSDYYRLLNKNEDE